MNDTNPETGPMTATLVANSGPSHGTLTFGGDGSFSYLAAPGYVGPDQFAYQAFNGEFSNSATVSLDVISMGGGQPPSPPAPVVVTAPSNQTAAEGDAQSFSLGSFTDGAPGPWTATVMWGDAGSSSFSPLTAASLGTWQHAHGAPGSY